MNTKNWKSSPKCQALLDNEGLDWDDLPSYFFKKYMKIVSDRGFHIDGWEDVWEYEKTGQTCRYSDHTE